MLSYSHQSTHLMTMLPSECYLTDKLYIPVPVVYLTDIPASLRVLAVPPDAIRSRPAAHSFLANSTKPFLFDTVSIAWKEKKKKKWTKTRLFHG